MQLEGQFSLQLYTNGGGHVLEISGSRGYWFYLHLFGGVLPSLSPNNLYELRQARLVNPDNETEFINAYVIIFWSNRGNNRAEKILSSRGNWLVQGNSGAPYILNNNQENPVPIRTTNTVAIGEGVAPMGTSGGVGSHLDLRLKSLTKGADFTPPYDINPLYHVRHNAPAYALNILYPEEYSQLYHIDGGSAAEQIGERVRVNINSASSKDLDRAKLYLFDSHVPDNSRVYDDSALAGRLVYGGLPPDAVADRDPLPGYITSSGEANRGSHLKAGISPIGTEPGNDDFFFIGFNTCPVC